MMAIHSLKRTCRQMGTRAGVRLADAKRCSSGKRLLPHGG